MHQGIHFIAIGGTIMHGLAESLQQQGYTITGSDDQIRDPARSSLLQHNLLPAELGWFPDRITSNLSAVIIGKNARADNPELIKAQKLGIPIFSYPDFVFQQSRQKQRVVIAGSHGKSTITALVLHVLNYYNRTFDYLIGEQIDGFTSTVRLTTDAPLIIIEGDEYASSSIDTRAKFLHYQPHIALISGIAWDHVDIYPTWEDYVDPFEMLAEAMPKAGILLFDESDDMLDVIGQKERTDITKIPYKAHESIIKNGHTVLVTKAGKHIDIPLFGDYNMKNIAAAMIILDRIGITENQFYEAVSFFKPIKGRQQVIAESNQRIFLQDCANSPAKVEATTNAVRQQYPDSYLTAVLELHALYSVNKLFLSQYKGCLDDTDTAVIYINEETLMHNSTYYADSIFENLKQAFDRPDLHIFTNIIDLQNHLLNQKNKNNEIILLMGFNLFYNLITNNLTN